MSKLIIEGGQTLIGEVTSSGAKNAALPILAATVLLEGESELRNVPKLMDIVTMVRMLNALGVRTEFGPNNTVRIWNNKKIYRN